MVDWARVDSGSIAVVDPVDPGSVLYLSEREYKIQVRVSQSNDSQLIVLARPGESIPVFVSEEDNTSSTSTSTSSTGDKTSSNKKLPHIPSFDAGPKSDTFLLKKASLRDRLWHKVLGWYQTNFRHYISGESLDDGTRLATVSNSNIETLIQRWSLSVTFWVSRRQNPTSSQKEIGKCISVHLARVLKHKGVGSLIKEMKFSSVIIRRYLAGNRCLSAWDLGYPIALSRSGLPLWLPLTLRRRIANQDVEALRYIFSVLHCYKGIEGPYKKPSYDTITDPLPTPDVNTSKEYREFCENYFWTEIVRKSAKEAGKQWLMKPFAFLSSNKNPFLPRTAGPNHSVSILGAALDTVAWSLSPVPYLKLYLEYVKDWRTLFLFEQVQGLALSLYPKISGAYQVLTSRPGAPRKRVLKVKELLLGKLSLAFEAAGKVRVVAIVDYWTQRALKPLHVWMMQVLSCLPSDATFDQEGSVRRAAAQQHFEAHSYDLKSATDLIPTFLYEWCLSPVLTSEFVEIWLGLLADRWYRTAPKSSWEKHVFISRSKAKRIKKRRALQKHVLCVDGSDPMWVKYTRGQPMGALSSWPSMSLVHHSLVHFAAFKAGAYKPDYNEFWDYRLLGDDLTIFSKPVGEAYVRVCEDLKVPIGLKVSLISNKFDPSEVDPQVPLGLPTEGIPGAFFEFASQFWKGCVNLTPISFKMELSIKSPANRIEFAVKQLTRYGKIGRSLIARLVRYLLPPPLYGESVGYWNNGVLGPTAQVALIIAFGPAAFLLERTGIQWSSFRPLLSAFANSSKIIGADQAFLAGQTQVSDADLDTAILITISYIKYFYEIMIRQRDAAQCLADSIHTWLGVSDRSDAEVSARVKPFPYTMELSRGSDALALAPVLRDHFTSVSFDGLLLQDTEVCPDDGDSGAFGYNLAQQDAVLLSDGCLRLETMLKNLVSFGTADPVTPDQPTDEESPGVLGSESFIVPEWLPDRKPNPSLLEDLLEGEIIVGGCIVTEDDIVDLLSGEFGGMPPGWVPPKRLSDWVAKDFSVPKGVAVIDPLSNKILNKPTLGSVYNDLREAFEIFTSAPQPMESLDVLFEERQDREKITSTVRAWRELVKLTLPALRRGGATPVLDLTLLSPDRIGWEWWGHVGTSEPKSQPILASLATDCVNQDRPSMDSIQSVNNSVPA